MSTTMVQDTTSLPAAGPRFRPYASSKHHVTKGRYITSNDPRGYIPVYEYPLNGQWIMMDIDDGYILWTGIWKALGNSKADIVKMIESQPNLASLIRRVRGGYLKIQGTWMPYEVALKLSRRVAWSIRDELVPLFGPNFPDTCLSPDQPGFGQVIPSDQVRRRSRKAAQNSIMRMPAAPKMSRALPPHPVSGFTTPSGEGSTGDKAHSQQWVMRPLMASCNPVSETHTVSPISINGDTGLHMDSTSAAHYNPLPPMTGLSIDARFLNSAEGPSDFKLPPIQSSDTNGYDSPYALPPISAMEDLRGSITQDSAAVLRRLRMDDDDYPRSQVLRKELLWEKRHSPAHAKKLLDASPRFQPYDTTRSRPDASRPRARSPSTANRDKLRQHYNPLRPGWSDTSQEDSTPDLSPISPTTSKSATEYEGRYQYPSKSNGSIRGETILDFTMNLNEHKCSVEAHVAYPLRREFYASNAPSSHPHRPW